MSTPRGRCRSLSDVSSCTEPGPQAPDLARVTETRWGISRARAHSLRTPACLTGVHCPDHPRGDGRGGTPRASMAELLQPARSARRSLPVRGSDSWWRMNTRARPEPDPLRLVAHGGGAPTGRRVRESREPALRPGRLNPCRKGLPRVPSGCRGSLRTERHGDGQLVASRGAEACFDARPEDSGFPWRLDPHRGCHEHDALGAGT